MNFPAYPTLSSQDLFTDELVSPANFFFNDPTFFQMDTNITIQEATPLQSPMNPKGIIPSNITIPTSLNYMDANFNTMLHSPMTSPFNVDPNMVFFPSALTSPTTFDFLHTNPLSNGESLTRRYSTPGTQQDFIQVQGRSTSNKPRRSSLRKPSNPEAPLKLYVCNEEGCNKVFKRSEHLKRHFKSIHSKERPHKCPVEGCNKAFARADNLVQHSRIHRTPEEKMATRGFTSFAPYVLPLNDCGPF